MPAPEGWCVGGGETSSRIGGVELGKRLSSSGMPKNVWVFGVSLLCGVRRGGGVGYDSRGQHDLKI